MNVIVVFFLEKNRKRMRSDVEFIPDDEEDSDIIVVKPPKKKKKLKKKRLIKSACGTKQMTAEKAEVTYHMSLNTRNFLFFLNVSREASTMFQI